MFTYKKTACILAFACVLVGCATRPKEPSQRFAIGTVPTAAEIQGWNIDVTPDGAGLPSGSGTVAQGRIIFSSKCAACHGAGGEGGAASRLVGGKGSLATAKPDRTVGSFWPYATTVYDYINRAMPFDRPQSLAPTEVYALTAYILSENGVVPPDAMLDAQTLPKIMMPNRNGFTAPDPRPDTKSTHCLRDCK